MTGTLIYKLCSPLSKAYSKHSEAYPQISAVASDEVCGCIRSAACRYTLRTGVACCGRVNNCCGATCFKHDLIMDLLDPQVWLYFDLLTSEVWESGGVTRGDCQYTQLSVHTLSVQCASLLS